MRLVLVVLGLLTTGLLVLGVAELSQAPRTHLDLPLGEGSEGTGEEDIPEIIQFYGNEYEGDGIFWAIDRSSTMEQTTAGGRRKFDVCKQEFAKAFQDLTEQMDFGVVFFDANNLAFRERPVEGTPENRNAAMQWVNSMAVGYGTCYGGGVGKALELANMSGKKKRTVIVVGDGVPSWCGTSANPEKPEQARARIKQSNSQHIPVNTICIGVSSEGRQFMQVVAQENGGQFTEVR